jgi:hypothetical protein
VWTQPGAEGPFLVDVTGPGHHRYGRRLRSASATSSGPTPAPSSPP